MWYRFVRFLSLSSSSDSFPFSCSSSPSRPCSEDWSPCESGWLQVGSRAWLVVDALGRSFFRRLRVLPQSPWPLGQSQLRSECLTSYEDAIKIAKLPNGARVRNPVQPPRACRNPWATGPLFGECTRIGHVIGVCLHVHASFAVATSLACPWNMVPPPPPSKNTVKHPGFARRRQTTMLRTSRRAPAALPWLRMPWGLMRYSALGVIAAAPRQVAAYGVYYLFCTAHVAPHAPSNACTRPS